MPKVLDSPFWLDMGDPHRLRSAMQTLTQPRFEAFLIANTDWRLTRVFQEALLERAVHGVADGLSPEHAVDEAIARIKQILGE
jgi:hypothetical protein